MLKAAGYEIRDQVLTNVKTGEPFTVELLSNVPLFERVFLVYKPSLERLGIEVTVRTVDEPQYENRLRTWDFDIIIYAWGNTLLPGNELRDDWSAAAADQAGSENIGGIKNPAVDAMIDRVVSAKNRADLVTAARALDRILLWNIRRAAGSYNKRRTARWDRSASRSHAEIRRRRLPRGVVVGCRQSCQSGRALLNARRNVRTVSAAKLTAIASAWHRPTAVIALPIRRRTSA